MTAFRIVNEEASDFSQLRIKKSIKLFVAAESLVDATNAF